MNVILSWGYEVNNDAFKQLMAELNVKYCAVLNFGEQIKPYEEGIDHEEINLYAGYETYMKPTEKMLPLDAEIIERMRKYETTAMDIIYRWRRSITTKETYKEIKEIYYAYLRYFNDFILTRKIHLLILFNMPHIPVNFMIYALCKVYNIPIVMQILMPLLEGGYQNKYLATDIEGLGCDFDTVYLRNQEIYRETDEDSIDVGPYLNHYLQEYSKKNKDVRRVIITKENKEILNVIKKYTDRAKLYISQNRYNILMNKLLYLLRIKYKSDKILHYVEKKEQSPDLNVPFMFFPLHWQPEASTLPQAGPYNNQLIMIDLLSSLLPEGTFLYVKEHPAYWQVSERFECISEVRSKLFYDSITSHKNVRLIRHDFSSLDLMDNCICVATATGSAGLESLCKGKPVLTFGNIFYNRAKGAYRIRSKEDCKTAINSIFGEEKIEITRKDIKIFFKTLEPYVVSVAAGEGEIFYDDREYPNLTRDECSERTIEKWLPFIRQCYPNLFINETE